MKKLIKGLITIAVVTMTFMSSTQLVQADSFGELDTETVCEVKATGQYQNWDGVTNVAQFVDQNENYCYAYDGKDYVTVVRLVNGEIADTIKLEKKYPKFGTVICDYKGNFYVVTGKENKGNSTKTKTIFISKYDSKGNFIKSVGDNGSSSLASYYDSGFYTKDPFSAGNCDAAICGNILAVNYARHMYSGHQSNSVFAIDINKMKKVNIGVYYNSHSFAQRIIPAGDGFLAVSEGDCYDRAFTISKLSQGAASKNYNVFDFWVPKGTLDKYDMGVLNNNFAHMGGLAWADSKHVGFVSTSAKSLSSKAKNETERLFIQVFNPSKNLEKAAAYSTKGTRSGKGGPNGDKSKKNYGVKWLTPDTYTVINPQIVADDDGQFIVLFEKYDNSYQGVYYMVLSKSGKVLKDATLYSKEAMLNPCEMPVYANGVIYWNGNKSNEYSNEMYVFALAVF